MPLNSGERLFRIAPPASHVRAMQPGGKKRQVAAWVKCRKMDIRHVG
jgi:hypothetical protein